MGQFRFKEKVLRLQIEDKEIQLPATSEFAKAWQDLGQEMIAYAKTIKDKDGLTEDDLVEWMDAKLTGILGEENMVAIFSGRDVEFGDQCDLVRFISSELSAYRMGNLNSLAKEQPQMAMAMKGESPLEVVGSARNKYKK